MAETPDHEVFIKNDFANIVLPNMEEVRRRGKLCDVTLKVEETRISAHKIVLAAAFPYFNAMFTHDMVETRQQEINMQGIDAAALVDLVNFAYSGRIVINGENVEPILIGANFLDMKIVKDACCDFLKKRLHPENVLCVQDFAERYNCVTLVEDCRKLIRIHFISVARTEEFLNLSSKQVMDIIGQDELYVSSEEQVFEAMMVWVKHDEVERAKQLPPLLALVRLPLMTPQYLADKVSQEDLIKNSLLCRDLVDESKDYHLMPERRYNLLTFKTLPRCCVDVTGVIFAVGGLTPSGESISVVEQYDPLIGRWQMSEPMTTLRSRVGIAVLNGLLYAIGGYDGQVRLNTVEAFDPLIKKWRRVAPMLQQRSALGAAPLEGKLYVCGGYDGICSLTSVECYDPELDQWTMVANMTRHRSAAGVTVFDGQVYALGGHDGLSIFDSVECYNNHSCTWTQVAPMLSKRCRHGVTTLAGKLYAAGGYDGSSFLKTVERFNPTTNQWTYITPMNFRRSRVALVANCGMIYAVGGYDGVTNLNNMEVFDLATEKWFMGPSMVAHEGGVGVGVVPKDPMLELNRSEKHPAHEIAKRTPPRTESRVRVN